MRATYIAGNWKMHKTVGEAVALADKLVGELADCPNRLLIAPPFTALAAVGERVEGTKIGLGAQNMCAEEEGAHTGEISPRMLKDLGVGTVIIGHSERRLIYGETDELIRTKVESALRYGFEVILCVGETLKQRESGEAEPVVDNQLNEALSKLAGTSASIGNLVIAYEPVWAIGTGKNATPEDAETMHRSIRRKLAALFSEQAADDTIIQYGGSVKPGNSESLLSMENIDGALVGGASLEAESFVPIARYGGKA